MTYSVVYRTGGESSCTWRKVLEQYESRDQAVESAAKLELMGYKALVHSTVDLDAIGMPIGWEYNAVDWENDEIVYGDGFTKWTISELVMVK